MKKVCVAVFDQAGDYFGDPFFRPTRGVAVRDFADAVNAPDSPYGRHPGDFDLRELGVFDTHSGRFEEYEQAVHLGNAAQYLEKE